MSKPTASKRTVDMFSGRTEAEEQAQREAIAKAEDIQDKERPPAEPLENLSDGRRAYAFEMQEHLSKNFGSAPEDKAMRSSFRLTVKGEWMFLEEMRNGKDGQAYYWSGMMFPYQDLYEITSVFVKASKAKKEQEDVS